MKSGQLHCVKRHNHCEAHIMMKVETTADTVGYWTHPNKPTNKPSVVVFGILNLFYIISYVVSVYPISLVYCIWHCSKIIHTEPREQWTSITINKGTTKCIKSNLLTKWNVIAINWTYIATMCCYSIDLSWFHYNRPSFSIRLNDQQKHKCVTRNREKERKQKRSLYKFVQRWEYIEKLANL